MQNSANCIRNKQLYFAYKNKGSFKKGKRAPY
jgi:hypothetical protein